MSTAEYRFDGQVALVTGREQDWDWPTRGCWPSVAPRS